MIALAVALFSLIPFAWMVNAAISEGFGFFVVPLVVLELMFLLAVVCIWRALATEEDEPEPRPRYFTPPPDEGAPQRTTRPAPRHAADRRSWEPATSTDSRLAAWADWWFNGLRDSRRQG